MTQKERVAILKTMFAGYDAPLDSKLQRPSQYGVTYTKAARRLLKKCERLKNKEAAGRVHTTDG